MSGKHHRRNPAVRAKKLQRRVISQYVADHQACPECHRPAMLISHQVEYREGIAIDPRHTSCKKCGWEGQVDWLVPFNPNEVIVNIAHYTHP